MTDAYPSFHHGIPYQYERERNRYGREQEIMNRRGDFQPRDNGQGNGRPYDLRDFGWKEDYYFANAPPKCRTGKEGEYYTDSCKKRNMGISGENPYWQDNYNYVCPPTKDRYGGDRDVETAKDEEIWKPRVDMFETGKGKLVCEFEMPGVPVEYIKVNMDSDTMEVWTTKPRSSAREDAVKYYSCERHFGTYHRRLDFPFRVDTSRASAMFENGVLKVTVFGQFEKGTRGVEIPIRQK